MSVWKITTEIASIRCMSATKVKELKSHTAIPFLAKSIPLAFLCSAQIRLVYLNI
jgi:hypothetical protein